jgi:hypothetical protein
LLQIEDAWNALEESAKKGPVSIDSSTLDISPLYPQFWSGPPIGKSVYVTRGFHPGDKRELRLNLDLSGVAATDLCFGLLGYDGTFQITSKQINGVSRVTVGLSAQTASTGNKSAILEVCAKDWKYPVARFPILLFRHPHPRSCAPEYRSKDDMASLLRISSSYLNRRMRQLPSRSMPPLQEIPSM